MDEIELMLEDMEDPRETQITRISETGEMDILPEMEDVKATITADYARAAADKTEAKGKGKKATGKPKAVATEETQSGTELH